MTDKNLPPVEYLRKRLRYEPETGKLFWRDCEDMPQSWLTRWVGKEAFTAVNTDGYRFGLVRRNSLKGHRVIFALHYGEWPKGQIDHINGIREDNRIQNLRVVTNQENQHNSSMRLDNISGFTGVYWHKKSGKWAVQINICGRKKYIGLFTEIEAAAEARAKASRQHGYTDRHGT